MSKPFFRVGEYQTNIGTVYFQFWVPKDDCEMFYFFSASLSFLFENIRTLEWKVCKMSWRIQKLLRELVFEFNNS